MLDGSKSTDMDGDPLTYAWTFVQRPAGSRAVLRNPTTVHPTFQVDAPGTYRVQLIVNDGQVQSAPDEVAITTTNSPPVARAGSDQTAMVTQTVTLDGSQSSDVDRDPLTYHWTLSRPQTSEATLSAVAKGRALDAVDGGFAVRVGHDDHAVLGAAHALGALAGGRGGLVHVLCHPG